MRFALAPMSAVFVVLTGAMFVIGAGLLALGLRVSLWPLDLGGAIVLATCGITWLTMRPTAFELGPTGLATIFPTWRQHLPRESITGARLIDSRTLRKELGFALRIGVGGLFGTFGWLWSPKRGMVTCWVSRTDGLVWIDRRGAGPLLITPERPEEMVAQLAALPARS